MLKMNSSVKKSELILKLKSQTNLKIEDIIPVVDYLIYTDFFLLDFEEIITDSTILQLKWMKRKFLIEFMN